MTSLVSVPFKISSFFLWNLASKSLKHFSKRSQVTYSMVRRMPRHIIKRFFHKKKSEFSTQGKFAGKRGESQ